MISMEKPSYGPVLYVCILFWLVALKTIAAPNTIVYRYDELGRLTFVEDSVNGSRDYDYDAAGNRCRVSIGNAKDADVECNGSPSVLPAAPTGLSLEGPFSPTGGYRAYWNSVPGAASYEMRLEDGRTIRVPAIPSGAVQAESDGPRPRWVRALNGVGAGPHANF